MATSDNSSAPLLASTSGATLPVTTLPVTTTQGNRAVSSFTPTMTIDVVDGGQDAGTSGASTQGNRAVSFAPTMTIDVDGGLDQTAPVLITRDADAPKVSGDKLVLRYTEANTLGTAHPDPAAHAFAVTVNGRTNPVTDVAVDSQTKTVTLTLTRPVTGGEDVSVAYPKPPASRKAIQDAAGNIADDIPVPFPVNSGTDTMAPTLVADTGAPPRIGGGGKQLVLTYEDANYLKAVQVPKTAFAVLVNGTPNDVTAVKVDGGQDKTVTLTLSRSVPSGADVSITYTPPGESTEAIQDRQGNPAAGILEPVHVDSGRDQTAPVLITHGDDAPKLSGNKLVLSYDEDNNLDTVHKAVIGSFTVFVDKQTNPVTEVSVATAPANTVTLTLAHALPRGVPVTVAYQATPGNAIQDMAGNRALDITEPMIHVDNGEAPTDPAQTAGTSGRGTPGTTAHDAGTSGVITTGATPPDASTSGTGTPGTGTSGTTAPDAGTPGVVTTGVTPHDSGTPGTGPPGTGTPGTGTPGTGTPGTGTSGTGTLGTGTSGTGTPGTATPGTGTSPTPTPPTTTRPAPAHPAPAPPAPAHPAPAHPAPAHPAPARPAPARPAPAHPAPAHPAPAHPAPLRPTPAHPASSQRTPRRTTPARPAPAPAHPALLRPTPAPPASSQRAPRRTTPARPEPAHQAPRRTTPARPVPAPRRPAPAHPAPLRPTPAHPAPAHPALLRPTPAPRHAGHSCARPRRPVPVGEQRHPVPTVGQHSILRQPIDSRRAGHRQPVQHGRKPSQSPDPCDPRGPGGRRPQRRRRAGPHAACGALDQRHAQRQRPRQPGRHAIRPGHAGQRQPGRQGAPRQPGTHHQPGAERRARPTAEGNGDAHRPAARASDAGRGQRPSGKPEPVRRPGAERQRTVGAGQRHRRLDEPGQRTLRRQDGAGRRPAQAGHPYR